MHRATGSLLLGDGSVWWIMACGLLLVWVGTKLLIDLWPCRLSSASLGLAASCYAAAVLVRLAWPSPHDALRPIMLQQGAAMSGTFSCCWRWASTPACHLGRPRAASTLSGNQNAVVS